MHLLPLLLLSSALLLGACAGPRSPAEQTLEHFYTTPHAPYSQVLRLGGPELLPLLLEKVKDPQMPRRRFALAYLGESGHLPAGEVLLGIVEDANERSLYRTWALQALCRLDPQAGLAACWQHLTDGGPLGYAARGLLVEPARFSRHVPDGERLPPH